MGPEESGGLGHFLKKGHRAWPLILHWLHGPIVGGGNGLNRTSRTCFSLYSGWKRTVLLGSGASFIAT